MNPSSAATRATRPASAPTHPSTDDTARWSHASGRLSYAIDASAVEPVDGLACEPRDATRRSLADIRPGEAARIEGILFGILRDLCSGFGLLRGDRVRCRRSSTASVVLEAADGHAVVLDQDWARFISIASCD